MRMPCMGLLLDGPLHVRDHHSWRTATRGFAAFLLVFGHLFSTPWQQLSEARTGAWRTQRVARRVETEALSWREPGVLILAPEGIVARPLLKSATRGCGDDTDLDDRGTRAAAPAASPPRA